MNKYNVSTAPLEEFAFVRIAVDFEEILSDYFLEKTRKPPYHILVIEEDTDGRDPRKDVVGFIFNGEFYARQTT